MNREEEITRTFVELADTLVEDVDAGALQHHLAVRCREILDIADAAVLLACEDRRLYSPAPRDPSPALSTLLDVAVREGPAADAYRTAATVYPGDLAETPGAWPGFTARARDAGYTHAAAVALRRRQETLGSLLLLSTAAAPLPAADLALAQAFADATTISLLHARALQQADTVNDQLRTALRSRVLIEQAKGILAVRRNISPDDAFTALRRHARHHHLRLVTVAQEVIDNQDLPQPRSAARPPGRDSPAE
ncbi:ANTAR domain-containing protein [Streptomyces rimosus]|uniref:ANTAR domain-containing protein n=1 Tax=Streptomyces rimosus TaxID=1927 RepID=UPI0004BEE297|nr:ANTAR domain-containing protein [Streptomyces rimosus]